MDSLATLNVPAIGYGIRYEFGIFDQAIRDGWQVELTDKWLRFGNPWEIVRSEITFDVNFGGRTEHFRDEQGRYRVRWMPDRVVKGVAYDTPVPGYRVPTTNLLRLWKAEAAESFDFDAFNVGDYYGAVHQKVASETISKVLYPNDEPEAGKQLRLAQQYFFVSCSLQDMIRLHAACAAKPLAEFDACWAVAVERHASVHRRRRVDAAAASTSTRWTGIGPGRSRSGPAATRTTRCWPKRSRSGRCRCSATLLPRHLEIIYEINRRFLDEVRQRHPGDDQLARRLSLIDETGDRYVRMAHLASVGSHAINGVAALHTRAAQADRAARLLRRVAGEVLQRHQRRDAAALDGAEQSEAERAHHQPHRRPLDRRPGGRAAAARAARRRRRASRREWRAVKADNKRALADVHQGAHRHQRRSGSRSSTSR